MQHHVDGIQLYQTAVAITFLLFTLAQLTFFWLQYFH